MVDVAAGRDEDGSGGVGTFTALREASAAGTPLNVDRVMQQRPSGTVGVLDIAATVE